MDPMSKLCAVFCVALAHFVTAASPDVERDRFGRPVRTEGRRPLLYGPEDQALREERATEKSLAIEAFSGAAFDPEISEGEAASNWSMRPLWWRHVYGTGIGDAGLVLADLDGDGHTEILAGSSSRGGFAENDSWVVVRASATASARYDLVFRSPVLGPPLTALQALQLDRDAALEVVAAVGSQILVYDGATRALQQVLPTSAAAIDALAVADADGDGDRELVLCAGSGVFVYDFSGVLSYSTPLPCRDLAVGQVDLDPAPEIVIGDGDNPGYVLDGQTHAVEWTNGFGFGVHVRLGNLDADARDEVVAGFAWQAIRIFDVDLHSLKASIPTDLDVAAVRLLDVEGDGPLEIVYGDGQWGEVHVLDGGTLSEKWLIPNPQHGITDVALGDPDADGVRELIWGAGHSSTGEDHLYVAGTLSQTIEWQSLDISGPFLALDVAPVVGTARRAVLAASFESNSGYGDGLYFFHRVLTGAEFYQSPPLTGLNWTGLTRLRSAQLDGDSQREVIAATSTTYRGRLVCLDTLTHVEQWHADLPDGLTVASLALGDVDADGRLEAVAGVEVQHTGATGVYVFVFDAATGAQEWQSPSLAGGFVDLHWLRLPQLDADPQREIVVGATNGQVYVLDRVVPSTISLGPQQVSALETIDTNGDGRAEIYVGTSSGAVRRIDPASGAVLETVFAESVQVDALAIGALDGDAVADYATVSGNVLRVRASAAAAPVWTSGVLSQPPVVVGQRDSLLLAQVDGRGQSELIVNLGPGGFVVFTAAP